MKMRLICARSRRRSAWQNIVMCKTVVGDDDREVVRAKMSGDGSKKKG